MSQTAPPHSENSTSSESTAPSLSSELDKLTTAVLEVSDNLQACAQESDARHAAYLARAEEQKQCATGFQDQIARMLAMTQEGLRREREEPLKGMDPPSPACLMIHAGVTVSAATRATDGRALR